MNSSVITVFLLNILFLVLLVWYEKPRKIGCQIYNVISNLLSIFLNTRGGFSDAFIDRYKNSFVENFKLKPEEEETNNYWFPQYYVVNKSPEIALPVNQWLRLYGFARNIATSFYLAFLYSCMLLLYYETQIPGGFKVIEFSCLYIFLIPLSYFFLSFLMLVRYYYLYVGYYTKYILRAYVYLAIMESKEKKEFPNPPIS